MPETVIATAIWKTDPALTDTCIESLRNMFPVTRQHKGFRNIRLLRSAQDPNELVLIQEWDSVQDHQNYMQFRTDSGDLAKLMAMTAGPMHLNYWTSSPLAAAEA
jgi:quinol monooxygenase YgiN